jgi:aryl carrier-like protein
MHIFLVEQVEGLELGLDSVKVMHKATLTKLR